MTICFCCSRLPDWISGFENITVIFLCPISLATPSRSHKSARWHSTTTPYTRHTLKQTSQSRNCPLKNFLFETNEKSLSCKNNILCVIVMGQNHSDTLTKGAEVHYWKCGTTVHTWVTDKPEHKIKCQSKLPYSFPIKEPKFFIVQFARTQKVGYYKFVMCKRIVNVKNDCVYFESGTPELPVTLDFLNFIQSRQTKQTQAMVLN